MTSSPDHLVASLADRYRIERLLGEGGAARVWLAHDLRHDRPVALKVLRTEAAGELGPERFLNEVRLTAKLQHPHILPLFDSGVVEGVPYYVMPYIDGESLRSRLVREGHLPLTDALTLIREVGDALAYAHEHGVVHRDVKPENILLAGAHALVADFGIARAGALQGSGHLTETGTLLGTPYYMSPEQAAGRSDLDGRSDQYSLACLLFELLTGAPPFTGDSLLAIVIQHTTDPAPTLASRRADLPASLGQAVARALAKEPDQRFATVTAFLEALSTGAAPAPERADSSIAVLPFANLSPDRDNEYFSDGLTEEISNALARVAGLRVAARGSTFAWKGKEADSREIGAKLGVSQLVEGSVRKAGERIRVTVQIVSAADGYRHWSETYDRTLTDVFALQDEIALGVVEALGRVGHGLPQPRPVRPPTSVLEAYTLYLRGRHFAVRRSPAGLRAGLELFEQALALDPDYALAHAGVAECWTLLGFEEVGDVAPLDAIPQARTALDRAIGLDPSLAEAHLWRGVVSFLFEYDRAAAMASLTRALEINPASSFAHAWLGLLLHSVRRHEEGLAHAREAERLDPLTSSIQLVVGRQLWFAGRLDEAAARLRMVFEVDPSNRVATWLARVLLDLGQARSALDVVEGAAGHFGRDPLLLEMLGCCLVANDRPDQAREVIRELGDLATRRHVSATHRASIHRWLGDIEAAVASYEEAARQHSGPIAFFWGLPSRWREPVPPRLRELLTGLGLSEPEGGNGVS
jgi:eukaryotic-like serine/threonine-protein kinase